MKKTEITNNKEYKTDILFICKKRMDSAGLPYVGGFSSGLFNSAKFVSDMLDSRLGYITKIVEVIDGNDVDREVAKYRPQLVVIEANWVTPDKFRELKRLHRNVKWMVRIHSEIPFLSLEGVAFEWIEAYLKLDIYVGFNSARTVRDFKNLYTWYKDLILYTPNYYSVLKKPRYVVNEGRNIDIGCFGAIRPFKNQLIQAVAAIRFAEENNKCLSFHVNVERIEGGGAPILKNLNALFHNTEHILVKHSWLPHGEFIKLVRNMDLGMQVSYNETFNIVSADFVANNIPIVTSDEVEFVHGIFQAECNSVSSIVNTMEVAWKGRRINAQYMNKRRLIESSEDSVKQWKKLLGK